MLDLRAVAANWWRTRESNPHDAILQGSPPPQQPFPRVPLRLPTFRLHLAVLHGNEPWPSAPHSTLVGVWAGVRELTSKDAAPVSRSAALTVTSVSRSRGFAVSPCVIRAGDPPPENQNPRQTLVGRGSKLAGAELNLPGRNLRTAPLISGRLPRRGGRRLFVYGR